MCGLFGGLSTTLVKNEISNIMQLGILSIFRGTDSTGMVAALSPKEQKKRPFIYDGHKSLNDAFAFFNEDKVSTLLNTDGMTPTCLMGHTRYATVGETNITNAHPHRFKHIIGCHNGTIHRFGWKEEDKKLGSDSRVLFHRLAEEGLDSVLKDADFGAYAISFINTKDHTINFVRNRDRPLWFMKTKTGTTIYWASEKRFLDFMADKAYNMDEPKELPVETLLTIKIGDPKEITEKKLTISTPWTYNHKFDRRWPKHPVWDDEYNYNGYDDVEVENKLPLSPGLGGHGGKLLTDLRSHNHRHPLERYKNHAYKGFNGDVMTIEEAMHLLDTGCNMCSQCSDIDDVVYWENKDNYYCEGCSKDQFVQNFFNPQDKGQIIELKECD